MIAINGKPYTIKYFPDGTLNMTDTYIQEQRDRRPVKLLWRFENLAEESVLRNLVFYIKDVLQSDVYLELPYVPNGRMDRVKRPTYEVHTLKYFLDFINSLGFLEVAITDPHSPVTMSMLKRGFERDVKEVVWGLAERLNVDYTFFPDKGAYDRYGYLIMRTPFYGNKTRDWNTGKITGYEIQNPYNIPTADFQDKSILIIDDISSYGGTFFHASNALKAIGFGDIYLYITHCENSILKGEVINSDNVKKIFTTSSIFTGNHPKIMVLD